MAKLVQFAGPNDPEYGPGEIDPSSTPVHFPASGILVVSNNDASVHSVVWDDGSPQSLLGSPANGADISPGGGSVSFNLAGLPQGMFTFHDGYNSANTGQLVVG